MYSFIHTWVESRQSGDLLVLFIRYLRWQGLEGNINACPEGGNRPTTRQKRYYNMSRSIGKTEVMNKF